MDTRTPGYSKNAKRDVSPLVLHQSRSVDEVLVAGSAAKLFFGLDKFGITL